MSPSHPPRPTGLVVLWNPAASASPDRESKFDEGWSGRWRSSSGKFPTAKPSAYYCYTMRNLCIRGTCAFVASSCHPERRSTTLVKKCNHGLKSDHVAKSVDRFRGLIYMIFPACCPGPCYDRCTPHNQLIFLSAPEKSRFDTIDKVSWYAYLVRATYSPIRRTG